MSLPAFLTASRIPVRIASHMDNSLRPHRFSMFRSLLLFFAVGCYGPKTV